MDFIERWFHISPDGGNGTLEFLIVASIVFVLLTFAVIAIRKHFFKKFIEYLEQLGNRDGWDRFD